MRLRANGLWRDADFARLWAGETVSLAGSRITQVALPLTAAVTLHAGALQMGLLGAMESLPGVVLGLPIGVWADRQRRRPLTVAANLGRAALLGTIPLAALIGHISLLQLYLVTLLAGTLSAGFGAAYRPYIRTLVTPERLIEANGAIEVSRSAAQITGPGAAGVLVQAIGAPFALALDAISFVASSLLLLAIRRREPPPNLERGSPMRRQIGEGLRALLDDRMLRPIIGCTGGAICCSALSLAVYVLYATRELGLTPAALGALYALGGGGGLIGALLARRITSRVGVGRTIVWAQLVVGAAAFLVPLAGALHGSGPRAAFALLALAQIAQGLAVIVYDVNWLSLVGALVPDRLQGRVHASIGVLIFALQPAGAVLGGVLGTLIGLRPTLLVAAVVWSLLFLWPLRSPVYGMRTLPDPQRS